MGWNDGDMHWELNSWHQIGEAERCCNGEEKSNWEKCLIQDLVYLLSGNVWNKLIYNTFYGLCSLLRAVFGDGNRSAHVPFGALTGVSTHKAGGGISVATPGCRMCTWSSHTASTQVLMGRCVKAQCVCVLCF